MKFDKYDAEAILTTGIIALGLGVSSVLTGC